MAAEKAKCDRVSSPVPASAGRRPEPNRAADQIRHSHLAYIDAKIVVERREDFAKRHRSFVGLASEPIRGADNLASFHSAASQQRKRK